MLKVRSFATGFVVFFALTILLAGCVSIKAPERISIGDHPHRIDSTRVPPTRSHEDARQLLAEAYERNRYLETQVAELKRDKQKLKTERDEYKRRYKSAKD